MTLINRLFHYANSNANLLDEPPQFNLVDRKLQNIQPKIGRSFCDFCNNSSHNFCNLKIFINIQDIRENVMYSEFCLVRLLINIAATR